MDSEVPVFALASYAAACRVQRFRVQKFRISIKTEQLTREN
jgi:hypothetical protein